MKQLLYVYIPGFEYDSKGPLHIDAIRLDVTVGEIEKNTNNIVNSLPTYIYIASEASTGNLIKWVPGNLIFRSKTTDQFFIDKQYNDNPSKSPLWTKEKTGRAVHGYFYDFITTKETEERTHHVIGIHNTPDACKNVSNFNKDEHDGLFIVQLEELNTDLILNFTFYSRIDSSSGDTPDIITVGALEGITHMTVGPSEDSEANFFDQDSHSNFFDKYIEIGKWTQTYNPATSGVKEGELQEAKVRNQYFDLETWGTEDRNWEIPVNAGVLVSDMSNDKQYLKRVGVRGIWKQFKYDNDSNSETYRMHICDDKLPCNNSDYDSYGDFYTNFYSGYRTAIKVESSKSSQYIGKTVFAREKSKVSYAHPQTVNCFQLSPSVAGTASFEYNLSYVNLNNLNYLYKQPIYLTINNLTHNSSTGNTSDNDCLVVQLDHYGINTGINDKIANYSVFDKHNFKNQNSSGSEWKYFKSGEVGNIPLATAHIKAYEKLPDKDKKEIMLSENILSLWYEKERADSYDNKTIDHYLKTYNAQRVDPKIKSGFKSSYLQTLKEKQASELTINRIIDQSLLNTGEHKIQLTNNSRLGIYINIFDISFPVLAYRKASDKVGYRYSSMIDNYLKQFSFDSNFSYSLQKNGIGTVTVFLPQMFQINLDHTKTNISKSNLADYKIIPMLFNDESGYSKGNQIPVNIDTTNLLDPEPNVPDPEPNSQEDSKYELQRIVKDKSIIKTTTQLLYKDNASDMEKTRYNSSFCNEKRFIGGTNDSPTISVEKTIPLAPGLYVFKIQNMYLKENNGLTITYSFDNNKSENVQGYYNKWVFLVKDACKFTLHKITRQQGSWKNSNNICDVISGIGLYKVNLDNIDPNTHTLNSAISGLKSSGFLSPSDYLSIYNQIIFPAAFCAQEDVHFCNRNDNYYNRLSNTTYKPDYQNDYCLNINNDPIYHYYNFKYLPSKAVYDIVAYYTIPTGNEQRIDPEKIQIVLEDQFDKRKLAFLGSHIVRL